MIRLAFFCVLTLVASVGIAEECSLLQGSGEGVPAIYYQERCRADREFSAGDFDRAVTHYENALSIRLFEAPNYTLRLELADSLCRAGKRKRGRAVLESFASMAKADLGEIECPDKPEAAARSEHLHLACGGYGSALTENGRRELRRRLERAESVRTLCSDTPRF